MVTSPVKEYMDYATMHGIGRLKNSPFIILKVFWILSLMGSLGMIIFQFIMLWDKFQSNPISTTIELMTPKAVEFPVVTICNTNPVKYYGFAYDTPLQKVVDDAFKKYSIQSNFFNDSYTGEATYSKEAIDNDVLWFTPELFRMTLSLYSYDELIAMSQNKEEFILLCNYNGKKCTNESTIPYRTFKYGICFNIYPEHQEQRVDRLATAAGKRHGLELLLNINQFEGVPFVAQSSGVYVMVHGQSHELRSTALHGGVIVPSGFEGDIHVSMTEHIRVPGDSKSPRCHEEEKTYRSCIYNCELSQIYRECGCYQDIHHTVDIRKNASLLDNSSTLYSEMACKTETDYKCIQNTLATLAEDIPLDSECSICRVPCKELRYETSLSVVSWPSKMFEPVLQRILSAVYGGMDINVETIRKDLVMIRVYFESLSYPSIKEAYSYSTVNFISDLGGTLGLWAGFSVLSLLELFELIVLLISYRKSQKNSVNSGHGDSNGNTVDEK